MILLGGKHEETPGEGYTGGAGVRADYNRARNWRRIVPLTHEFKETMRRRAARDPDFRRALLREAVESIINGDLPTGKAVLRDYVNATVGFHELERCSGIPAKSLMRMLGPKGSPSAANLTRILTALQKSEGVHFELAVK